MGPTLGLPEVSFRHLRKRCLHLSHLFYYDFREPCFWKQSTPLFLDVYCQFVCIIRWPLPGISFCVEKGLLQYPSHVLNSQPSCFTLLRARIIGVHLHTWYYLSYECQTSNYIPLLLCGENSYVQCNLGLAKVDYIVTESDCLYGKKKTAISGKANYDQKCAILYQVILDCQTQQYLPSIKLKTN